jgi:transcriptional regulator with XRE-family HTH domain
MENSIAHKRVKYNPHTGFLLRQNTLMKNSQIIDDRLREVIATNLVRLMGEHTDASLGKVSGVGRSTIQRIRNKQTSPSVENLAALADAFGIPLVEMISEPGTAYSGKDGPPLGSSEVVEIFSIYGRLSVKAREKVLDFMRTQDAGEKSGASPVAANYEFKGRPR